MTASNTKSEKWQTRPFHIGAFYLDGNLKRKDDNVEFGYVPAIGPYGMPFPTSNKACTINNEEWIQVCWLIQSQLIPIARQLLLKHCDSFYSFWQWPDALTFCKAAQELNDFYNRGINQQISPLGYRVDAFVDTTGDLVINSKKTRKQTKAKSPSKIKERPKRRKYVLVLRLTSLKILRFRRNQVSPSSLSLQKKRLVDPFRTEYPPPRHLRTKSTAHSPPNKRAAYKSPTTMNKRMASQDRALLQSPRALRSRNTPNVSAVSPQTCLHKSSSQTFALSANSVANRFGTSIQESVVQPKLPKAPLSPPLSSGDAKELVEPGKKKAVYPPTEKTTSMRQQQEKRYTTSILPDAPKSHSRQHDNPPPTRLPCIPNLLVVSNQNFNTILDDAVPVEHRFKDEEKHESTSKFMALVDALVDEIMSPTNDRATGMDSSDNSLTLDAVFASRPTAQEGGTRVSTPNTTDCKENAPVPVPGHASLKTVSKQEIVQALELAMQNRLARSATWETSISTNVSKKTRKKKTKSTPASPKRSIKKTTSENSTDSLSLEQVFVSDKTAASNHKSAKPSSIGIQEASKAKAKKEKRTDEMDYTQPGKHKAKDGAKKKRKVKRKTASPVNSQHGKVCILDRLSESNDISFYSLEYEEDNWTETTETTLELSFGSFGLASSSSA